MKNVTTSKTVNELLKEFNEKVSPCDWKFTLSLRKTGSINNVNQDVLELSRDCEYRSDLFQVMIDKISYFCSLEDCSYHIVSKFSENKLIQYIYIYRNQDTIQQ